MKTIIFDIDETLYPFMVNNRKAQEKLDQYCQRTFGWLPGELIDAWLPTYHEVTEQLGYHNSCIHDILLRVQVILEKRGINPLPHARTMYHMYWDTIMENIVPFEGVVSFLEKARAKGIRLGLGTDMMTDIQYRKLEVLGLIHAFDFIVTSEEAGYEKPQERFFKKVLEKTQYGPEECLMVGDNWDRDILGALNAGMKAAWFRPDVKKEDVEPEKAEILYRSYEELMASLL